MAELAIDITQKRYQCTTFVPHVINCQKSQTKNNDVPAHSLVVLGAILILLQILDGILTARGVSLIGHVGEGNVIIRFIMEYCGVIPALLIAKSFAISVICAICVYAKSFSWVKYAMGGTAFIYATFAILPWIAILSDIQTY